jgi:hypothetical protein
MTGSLVPRRRRRYVGVAVSVAVLAAGATAVGYAASSRPHAVNATTGTPPTGTATVTRGTVTERVQVGGTLGFSGAYSVIDQGLSGIMTSAAQPGTVLDRGAVLYAVANQPVRLLFGATPAYRDLAPGITDGPDVQELEANLVALGLDPHHDITVDDHFTAATSAAIRRWQASWGLPTSGQTGWLPIGQVVFLPGPLRVSQVHAQIGSTVGPDTVVLAGTSTDRVATAQLNADEQTLIQVGDTVLVEVSGQPPRSGTVSSISQPGSAATGTSAANGPATVTVTVSLPNAAGLPSGEQVPVQVGVTTATHPNVLEVPVTALLARPGGGYQVRLASGADVRVQPGLFDETEGTVEVSGTGLAVGQRVEVPTS